MFYGILAALAAVIVGLDQWTKWLTVTHIPSTNGSAVVRAIPGFFHITHIKNTGAAWSMLEGQTWLFVLVTVRAFRIYSFSFLLAGVAILGSSFFTALNDGLTSALISFLRTLVFQIAAVLLLPLVLELDGIWLSIVFAETMAVLVTTVFLLAKRKKYGY